MSDNAPLTISDVRLWANAICDAFEATGITDPPCNYDHYWEVYVGDAFRLDQKPDVVCGQLSDDIDDLRAEVVAFNEGSDKGMLISHACEHFAGVIRYSAVASGSLAAVGRTGSEDGNPHV